METGCEYGVAPDSHLEVQYVQLVFIACGPSEVRAHDPLFWCGKT